MLLVGANVDSPRGAIGAVRNARRDLLGDGPSTERVTYVPVAAEPDQPRARRARDTRTADATRAYVRPARAQFGRFDQW